MAPKRAVRVPRGAAGLGDRTAATPEEVEEMLPAVPGFPC